MDREELDLIIIAELSLDDKDAQEAIEELQKKYDPTYIYCLDCDGMVVKKANCCLVKMKKVTDETMTF